MNDPNESAVSKFYSDRERGLRDRIAQLETENAKLKQQLQAMARLLKALPHDPTTEGMLHRDY